MLLDSTAPNAGPGEGAPTSGPNPVKEITTYKRADGEYEIPDVTSVPGANVWTVDDDGVQCPNAEFEHVQEAVDYASPGDTIVVCPGVYYESSTPINSELNPVLAEGEKDGLKINKTVKIIGEWTVRRLELLEHNPALAASMWGLAQRARGARRKDPDQGRSMLFFRAVPALFTVVWAALTVVALVIRR